ncbi:MAG: ABC transporter ATP-binding protein [bacterium]|nr:ABC transporter ATP-binding protein [bacterium]
MSETQHHIDPAPARGDDDAPALLRIDNLHTYFTLDDGVVRAVDGVSLTVPRGKTLGVVGESGSGKSVMAFSVLRLVPDPGRIAEGSIALNTGEGDVELTGIPRDGRVMRKIRGNRIAMVFQEPMTSLSPVHMVGSQIMEAVLLHAESSKAGARRRTLDIMKRVGIPDAERRFRQYPHELSGGLRQRAMIAMALSCRPDLLIADEPTTALDVTIQAQILDLMIDLQKELGMSIMIITHDLGVVAQIADEVAVMYMGRVVEQADVQTIFKNPQHPYTLALMRSIPSLSLGRKTDLAVIRGSVPDPFQQLNGCPFHPRCPEAAAGVCDVGERPVLEPVAPGHLHACIRRHQEAAK